MPPLFHMGGRRAVHCYGSCVCTVLMYAQEDGASQLLAPGINELLSFAAALPGPPPSCT